LKLFLNSYAHTTSEEFENGGLTTKTHKMFSVHSRPEKFKMKQSPVISDLCLSKTRARKSADYRDNIVVEKLRFQNVFRLPKKTQKRRFKIPPV